eukprot:6204308-Pleurochrysis_carterae.AAC.1
MRISAFVCIRLSPHPHVFSPLHACAPPPLVTSSAAAPRSPPSPCARWQFAALTQPSQSLRDVFAHMLLNLPGVCTQKVERILQLYPTPHELATALDAHRARARDRAKTEAGLQAGSQPATQAACQHVKAGARVSATASASVNASASASACQNRASVGDGDWLLAEILEPGSRRRALSERITAFFCDEQYSDAQGVAAAETSACRWP